MKSQEFDLNEMNSLVEILILDHNNEIGQRKNIGKKGDLKCCFVVSKLPKERVIQPVSLTVSLET